MVCRRTRRKTRKTKRNRRRRGGRRRRTRHRGGSPGVAANASPVEAEVVDVEGEAVADNKAGDGGKAEQAQKGGKRRGRKRKSSKKKQKGGKRKLNAYFKAMLSAKKSKAASFQYKGKTYKGRKHARLGMIYSKA